MNFLNPLFLFGLIAVAIPVVIHLINVRRPKKISFSTLSFFNELQKSTLRRIRIKQYLLMALRALALLFLALSLAGPFLPPTITGSAGSGEAKVAAIIIDNSPSMSRIGKKGPLIDQAKEIAGDILSNANYGDKFLIISTNGENEINTAHPAAQANELVDEVTIENTAHYTLEAVRTAYRQIQNSAQAHGVIYVISDGQKSQLNDLKEFSLQSGHSSKKAVSIQLIKLENADQQNIAVSSVALNSQMLSKDSPVTLAVEIENVGDVAVANKFVSVEVGGELRGQYEVSLQPGDSRKYLFQIVPEKTGTVTGRILLEGDEVAYDNVRYFAVHIPKSRSVLLIGNEEQNSSFRSYLTPALKAAQQTNTQLEFIQKGVGEVDQSQWTDYDVIALDGLKQVPEYWFRDLQRYVQNGNGLLFLPSEQGDVENYNRFFGLFNAGRFTNVVGEFASFKPVVQMGNLKEGHPVIRELFDKKEDEAIRLNLPSLFFYYDYKEPSNAGAMSVLEAANGDVLLSEQNFGEGVLLISAMGAGPGWSNFPVNPLFAPIYYRSLLYASSSENGGLQQHQLGSPFIWTGELPTTGVTIEINQSEFKPDVQQHSDGIQIRFEGRKWQPGILSLISGDEKHKIAVNQSIMESYFDTLEKEQWQKIVSETFEVADMIDAEKLSSEHLEERLKTAAFGKKIWHWFIWLGLLFLLAETLVSRFYQAESIS